jgi:hypothetical protein
MDGVQVLSWYGKESLLKRLVRVPDVQVVGHNGKEYGRFDFEEVTEYLGENGIDPDTLSPWGSPN